MPEEQAQAFGLVRTFCQRWRIPLTSPDERDIKALSGQETGDFVHARVSEEVVGDREDDAFHYSADSNLPWQFLYFLPLPQGQGSFLPTFFSAR